MAKESRESVSFSEKVDIIPLCIIMIPGDCNYMVRLSPQGVDVGA